MSWKGVPHVTDHLLSLVIGMVMEYILLYMILLHSCLIIPLCTTFVEFLVTSSKVLCIYSYRIYTLIVEEETPIFPTTTVIRLF